MAGDRTDDPAPVSPLRPGQLAPGAADPMASLSAFVAAAAVDEAARHRRARYWQRRMALDASSFADVLADCADRGDRVVVDTPGGRFRGRITELGRDYVALDDGARRALIARRAIAGLSTASPDAPAAGEGRTVRPGRDGERDAELADRLSALAAIEARAVVECGARDYRGELSVLGRDYLRIRVSAESTGWAYVPVDSITAVWSDEREAFSWGSG